MREQTQEKAAAQRAERRKYRPAEQRNENAVCRHTVGRIEIPFPQPAGQQRVDAHRRADGHRDHQALHGKRKAHTGERVFAYH